MTSIGRCQVSPNDEAARLQRHVRVLVNGHNGPACKRCVEPVVTSSGVRFGLSRPVGGDGRVIVSETGAVGTDRLREVRRVVSVGDGAAALAVAVDLGLSGALQPLGELMLLALLHDAEAAEDFARRCSGALRARGRDGDQGLADAIDAARGLPGEDGVPLRELAVDLEQLADLLDSGPDSMGGRLDLVSGEVWPEFAFDDTEDDDEDEDEDGEEANRWLHVWPSGSRRAFVDMADFTANCGNERLRSQLDRALEGRGAFRRFKGVLHDWPDHREDWFVFSDDRRRGRARAWLADAGYRAAPSPRPASSD